MDWTRLFTGRPRTLAALSRKAGVPFERLMRGPLGTLLSPVISHLRKIGLVSPGNRFVLTIGDDGATLVSLKGDRVVDALFVGPESEEGVETLRPYCDADPQVWITVAVDVLEQMYREEQIPKVNRFDRLTIVRRRLDSAFPHDRLKAAVPRARAKDGSLKYMFTALPETPYIAQWISFLESLQNPIVGFCLLPLESEDLAARLSPRPPDDGRRVWHALVSQEATSGFRQIFETNGHLVVTRLTQRPPGDLTPDHAALLIERELRSSISYIKRLGYNDTDRLDLVVLADPATLAAVEQRSLPVTQLTAMTPHQAANFLDFGPIGPEESGFSDVLHAVNLAVKQRPSSLLPTAKIQDRLHSEHLFRVSFAAAAALTLFTVLYCGNVIIDIIDALGTSETMENSLKYETQNLEALRQTASRFQPPLDDLFTVVQTDDQLAKAQINPVALMQTVGRALDPLVRVQKITFAAREKMVALAKPAARAVKPGNEDLYEIQLTLRFIDATVAEADQATQHAKRIRDRLIKVFPGHEVTLLQLPFAALRSQAIEGDASSAAPIVRSTGAAIADYVIRKRG